MYSRRDRRMADEGTTSPEGISGTVPIGGEALTVPTLEPVGRDVAGTRGEDDGRGIDWDSVVPGRAACMGVHSFNTLGAVPGVQSAPFSEPSDDTDSRELIRSENERLGRISVCQ